jgi:PadR family transcriptional regulator, regulatory protein AphA
MTDTRRELPVPAYVVLGMVSLGARSGYQIKQDVERSIRFFWTISQAQIYPSLQRLEADGLISGQEQPSGRRRRRVFQITDAGRAALRAWLADTEPIPFELRDVGLLKLFFADASPPADASQLLEAVRLRSQQRIRTLAAIRPAAADVNAQGNPYPLLTLEMGIAFHQAMADVCAQFVDLPGLGSPPAARPTDAPGRDAEAQRAR